MKKINLLLIFLLGSGIKAMESGDESDPSNSYKVCFSEDNEESVELRDQARDDMQKTYQAIEKNIPPTEEYPNNLCYFNLLFNYAVEDKNCEKCCKIINYFRKYYSKSLDKPIKQNIDALGYFLQVLHYRLLMRQIEIRVGNDGHLYKRIYEKHKLSLKKLKELINNHNIKINELTYEDCCGFEASFIKLTAYLYPSPTVVQFLINHQLSFTNLLEILQRATINSNQIVKFLEPYIVSNQLSLSNLIPILTKLSMHTEIILKLLEPYLENNQFNLTCLLEIFPNGAINTELLSGLLKRNASVRDTNSEGKTLIELLCSLKENYEIYTLIKILVRNGGAANPLSKAVKAAIQAKNIEIVRYLRSLDSCRSLRLDKEDLRKIVLKNNAINWFIEQRTIDINLQ